MRRLERLIDRILRGESLSRALYKTGEKEELRRYLKNADRLKDIERISKSAETARKYGIMDLNRWIYTRRITLKKKSIQRKTSLITIITIVTIGVVTPISALLSSFTLDPTQLLQTYDTDLKPFYVFGLLQTLLVTSMMKQEKHRLKTLRNIAIYTLAFTLSTAFFQGILQ